MTNIENEVMTVLKRIFFYIFISNLFFFSTSLFSQEESDNPFLQTTQTGQLTLTEAGASHFARLALDCLQKEYPNKLNQVLSDSTELREPHELHPAFYGCFDWHSSVHGHWMLVKLLKQFPDLPEGKEIRTKISQNITKENIAAEVIYLQEESKSWERTYGWAWLLKLAEELYSWEDGQGADWYNMLQPLTQKIATRYENFLPVQKYPIRTGTHPNTAFGLSFAWDYAEATGAKEFKGMIENRAKRYYYYDHNCPADWEPSGEDFLSACLEEANLMRRVLTKKEYNRWFKYFLPRDKILSVVRPASVSDRSDPKIVHLDGLNLSRVWNMYGIIPKLSKARYRKIFLYAAAEHLRVTLPNIASQNYEGAHWLASFVVYALSVEEEQQEILETPKTEKP